MRQLGEYADGLERREQAGAAVGLCSWKSVRPASQAPPPGEGSATMLDLQLAHAVLERLQNGDQRQAISETLCHLHADRSGNTHRSEISLDKLWESRLAGRLPGADRIPGD